MKKSNYFKKKKKQAHKNFKISEGKEGISFCLYSQNSLQYLNESYRITFFHLLLALLICYPLVSLTHTLCFSKRNPAKVSSQLAIHPQEERNLWAA